MQPSQFHTAWSGKVDRVVRWIHRPQFKQREPVEELLDKRNELVSDQGIHYLVRVLLLNLISPKVLRRNIEFSDRLMHNRHVKIADEVILNLGLVASTLDLGRDCKLTRISGSSIVCEAPFVQLRPFVKLEDYTYSIGVMTRVSACSIHALDIPRMVVVFLRRVCSSVTSERDSRCSERVGVVLNGKTRHLRSDHSRRL